jgi:DNA polymerase (family 10)
MDAFIRLPHVKEVTLHGPTRSSIVTAPGLPVDIRIVPPESYGSLLQHLTGSRSHNIRLREMAQRCGATINEYGLFSVETGKRLTPGDDERYVYEFLGLQFIPPELREDRGEIEAASRHQLPRLIEMEEIQGDLHCHTRWSDGAHSVAQMADAARALGYRYLVLTDHSPSLEVARGLSVERLTQRAEEVAAYNAAHPDFRVLNGVECDILPDGSLDYPQEVLRQLDLVVASVHSGLNMAREEMTRRVVKALESGCVDILGHATGRVINRRDPYAIDLEQVFEAARRTNTALEINAFPDRLDLRDVDARAAKEHGVLLALGSDSHSIYHLPLMQFGVYTARRAWLEAKDVLNTRPVEEILQAVADRRRRGVL